MTGYVYFEERETDAVLLLAYNLVVDQESELLVEVGAFIDDFVDGNVVLVLTVLLKIERKFALAAQLDDFGLRIYFLDHLRVH